MLEPAISHAEELQFKYRITWFDDYYKFANYAPYCMTLKIEDVTINKHQFVSVYGGNIIGLIQYEIDRFTNNVSGLCIMNFYPGQSPFVFAKDLGDCIRDIFEKFKFNKINFSVIVGNPIEPTYDKLVKKYGGRIVGIKKKDKKLFDGKLYDLKLYEIERDEYIKRKKFMKRKKTNRIHFPISYQKEEMSHDSM